MTTSEKIVAMLLILLIAIFGFIVYEDVSEHSHYKYRIVYGDDCEEAYSNNKERNKFGCIVVDNGDEICRIHSISVQ